MKLAFFALCSNITPIILAYAAFWLASHDKEGWGWFLTFALLTVCTIKSKKGEGE